MGERVRSVRVSCINQVLGTDMKKHFDIVSRFQARSSPLPLDILLNQLQMQCCIDTGGKWMFERKDFDKNAEDNRQAEAPYQHTHQGGRLLLL